MLISLFLTIGILCAIVDGVILVQRPQIYKSKASTSANISPSDTKEIVEFTSPKGIYNLSYDSRLWIPQKLSTRTVFNLNKEYGFARLDIIEGESEKDLDSLVAEFAKEGNPVNVEQSQFQGKPSYTLTYKEQVVGEDVFFRKQIVKDNNNFLIFEERTPRIGYGDGFLANLLAGISFAKSNSAKVQGLAASGDLTTVQLVDLVRPSIANIVYVYCLDIVNLSQNSLLSKPRYSFCGSSKGSGFIINEDGVVATNGHVVRVYPEEALVNNLLQEGGKDLSTDLIKSIYLAKGQTPSLNQIEQFYNDLSSNPHYMDRFLTEIFDLIGKKLLSVAATNERYYVNIGNEPIEVDYQKLNQGDYVNSVISSASTFNAKLIDANYPNRYSYEAVVNKNYYRGIDVALLRIDNFSYSFPALVLGSIENLREGSEVVIAGYPTLVEGEKDPRAAISYKTSTKPTITRGIVSAVKQDLTGKTILQTDASIDHGNSGGPAFNPAGQVIGIATFMAESKTGNFNFLRDVSELKDLMTKNKIENKLDSTSSSWQEGLRNFRNKRYNQAIRFFKEVESLSPGHASVKEFIKLSEGAISKGENLEGLSGFIKGEESNYLLVIFGGISVTSFMFAGFLASLPLFTKDRSNYL